jgi:uncharacterized membrane protein HdeD (DUF308 family)
MVTDIISKEISKRTGWSIFMGILTAAVGVVMILYPLSTAAVSTVFFGSALIIAAVAQLVFAFSSQTAGQFFLKLLLGILRHRRHFSGCRSGIGVATLTAMLGAMLIAEAVVETVIVLTCGGRPRRFCSTLCSVCCSA